MNGLPWRRIDYAPSGLNDLGSLHRRSGDILHHAATVDTEHLNRQEVAPIKCEELRWNIRHQPSRGRPS
jgi:hypothetical protein